MSLADSEFEALDNAAGFEDAGFGDEGFDQSADAPMDGAMDSPSDVPMRAPEPVYRKQGFNIYTIMLILSFLFLMTAMILLFQEAGRLK